MNYADYLIIGGGAAGSAAAETIRNRDKNGIIVIATNEPHPFYSRVLLPHYVQGKVKREFIFLKKEEWYEAQKITLLKNTRLVSIKPDSHEAVFGDKTVYKYKKLLLATGGEPRRLDFPELSGITYFRTIDDADNIIKNLRRIAERPANEQVGLVYGAGFIGFEYLNIFRQKNIETHLITRTNRLWGNNLDEFSEKILLQILSEEDIHLHQNVDCVKVEGSKELETVDIRTARLPAKIMGIGVGVIQNMEAAMSAGLKTNLGIIVNEYLETDAPDIYTAGDVAEFFDITADRHRLVKNWTNAEMQGRHVGKVMTDERVPFKLVTSQAINVFDNSITFIGDISHDADTKIIKRNNLATKTAAQFFIRNNRLCGATLINLPKDRFTIASLIQNEQDMQEFETSLSDSGFDLKNIL